MRGITPGNSKQGISSDLRDHVVPDELGNFDPFSPVVLLVTDISPKVLVDFTIQSLHLSVGLRMECSGHLSFNAQQLIQLPQEVAHKDRSMVGDYSIRKSMLTPDMVPTSCEINGSG